MKKIMDAICNFLSKPSKLILCIGGLGYGLLSAVLLIVRGAQGNQAFPIITALILASLILGGTAVVPFLVFTHKDEVAKFLFSFLAGFWVISNVYAMYNFSQYMVQGARAIAVAYGTFGLITSLTLATAVVFVLFSYFFKKDIFRYLAEFLFVVVVGLALIRGIMCMSYYGTMNGVYEAVVYTWDDFMSEILDSFCLPTIVLAGYVYFYRRSNP